MYSWCNGPKASKTDWGILWWLKVNAVAVFIPEDTLSVWTNLGKHLSFVGLCVSSLQTGTMRIMRLDELPFVIRLERRKTEDSSSRRIMLLVPVFKLETHNPTNNKCLFFFLFFYVFFVFLCLKDAVLMGKNVCIARKWVSFVLSFFISNFLTTLLAKRCMSFLVGLDILQAFYNCCFELWQ